MTIVIVNDATHANIAHLPPGPAAGYSTGTPDIAWTDADWAAHPGAVRIDQSPTNTALDELADEIDYENGAATLSDLPGWVQAAEGNFNNAVRAGQRWPAVYASASNITAVVNSLISGGVTSGVGLHVANWNDTEAVAAGDVNSAAGPFPIIAVQFRNAGLYDVNVYSQSWLNRVSGKAPVTTPVQGIYVEGIHTWLGSRSGKTVTVGKQFS